MLNKELIVEIKIPKYPTKVCISNKRQKKYFHQESKKELPKKYQDKRKYRFDNKGILIDRVSGEQIIANPRSWGTPKYLSLAGNNFTTGFDSPIIRNKLVNELKDFYRPFVRTISPISSNAFPLRAEWDIFTTVDIPNWDLSNFWFYYKYFEDLLHEKEYTFKGKKIKVRPIMPDDSIRYVTQAPSPLLWPIDDFEKRGFIFRYYKDTRKIIRIHPLWKI